MKKRILDFLLGVAIGGILGVILMHLFGYAPISIMGGSVLVSLYFLGRRKIFSALGAIVGGPIVGLTYFAVLIALACATGDVCL